MHFGTFPPLTGRPVRLSESCWRARPRKYRALEAGKPVDWLSGRLDWRSRAGPHSGAGNRSGGRRCAVARHLETDGPQDRNRGPGSAGRLYSRRFPSASAPMDARGVAFVLDLPAETHRRFSQTRKRSADRDTRWLPAARRPASLSPSGPPTPKHRALFAPGAGLELATRVIESVQLDPSNGLPAVVCPATSEKAT